MFSYILFKYIVLSMTLIKVSINGNEVENQTTSKEVIDIYAGKINEKIETMENCLLADLRALAVSNSNKKEISVIFELSDSRFKNCFTFFDVFLKNGQRDVDAAKVPYNYNINRIASHIFENVSCGSYGVVIQPCFNNWQCSPLNIEYPKPVNMTSNCIGQHSASYNQKMQEIHSQGLEKKILLITTVVAISLLLLIGVLYHKLATRKRRELFIEGKIGKTENNKVTAKTVEVFIINHYNNTTLKKVELLKDFMSHCPNLNVILIEDGLAVSLITGSEWLNSMLGKDENDKVIKKLIIVDSVEEMEAEENENENGTFYEAIKKLSCDWSRSIDDYDNLFVVHFNSSFTKLKELDYIVKRVRYCIPDHLITLCLNLMSGTQCDAHSIEEKLTNLLYKHDIRNLGTYHV